MNKAQQKMLGFFVLKTQNLEAHAKSKPPEAAASGVMPVIS
ncbi:hypothetical protein [Aliidiomarina taiwanensis]|nr:hypothetical protein [Aliidiomarina taiwanensis]